MQIKIESMGFTIVEPNIYKSSIGETKYMLEQNYDEYTLYEDGVEMANVSSKNFKQLELLWETLLSSDTLFSEEEYSL